MNKEEQCLLDFLKDISCLEKLNPFIKPFNIFDVLKSSKHEIRHSNMLAWLLNPHVKHGLGDKFLRQFITDVVSIKNEDIMQWLMLDLNQVRIIREWSNFLSDKKDKLDILILIESNKNNFLIAIENKINAHESKGQTEKYRQALQKCFPEHKKLFVFLTPFGEEAKDENWINLDYVSVQQNLKKLLESGSFASAEAQLLAQHYNKILEDEIVGNEQLAKICQEIYKKHKEALDLIFENQEDISAEVAKVIKTILEQLAAEGVLIYDKEFDSGNTYLRFRTKTLDELLGFSEENSNIWNRNNRYYFEIHCRNLKFQAKLPICFTLALNNWQGQEASKEKVCKIITTKNKLGEKLTHALREFLLQGDDTILDFKENEVSQKKLKEVLKAYVIKVEKLIEEKFNKEGNK